MAVDVLVTGGNGVLGRNISQVLRSSGLEVVSCGRTPGENVDSQWDISFQDAPESDCRPRTVVHSAAHLGRYGSSLDGAISQFDVNATGTLRVVRWCAENNVSRLVLISGAVVYGQWDESPKIETDPTEPWWAGPYAVSKWASEGAASLFLGLGGQLTILRLTSLYGKDYKTGLIPRFIQEGQQTGTINLDPPFDDSFDLLHVEDAAQTVRSAVESEYSGIWNAGGGSLVTIKAIAEACSTEVDASLTLSGDPPPRSGRITNWVNDQKARRELGHSNSVSLSEGISEIAKLKSGAD